MIQALLINSSLKKINKKYECSNDVKQKTFENWIECMDSWDFPIDGFSLIVFKDHFFSYSKLSNKSLYMDQIKLIIHWYKLIAQFFKH